MLSSKKHTEKSGWRGFVLSTLFGFLGTCKEPWVDFHGPSKRKRRVHQPPLQGVGDDLPASMGFRAGPMSRGFLMAVYFLSPCFAGRAQHCGFFLMAPLLCLLLHLVFSSAYCQERLPKLTLEILLVALQRPASAADAKSLWELHGRIAELRPLLKAGRMRSCCTRVVSTNLTTW